MQDRTMPLRSIDTAGTNRSDNQLSVGSMTQFQHKSPLHNNIISIISEDKILENTLDKKSDVEVCLTKDRDLLQQYYDLRHYSYREENGWKNYDGSENEFDRRGQIVVALKDGKVVGGMRMMFSDQCQFMSNEIPGTQFNYKNLIYKYDTRENLIFSEISALVVEKNNRDSNVTSAMMDLLFKASKEHGCHYVFGVAVATVCRSDRRTLRRLGYDVEIVMNFPWRQKETYNFVRMFPMHTKLQ